VRLVHRAAVLRRLLALVHAVVSDHAGNAQPIIGKNFRAAPGLATAMLRNIAPGLDRGFVAKERQ
jgi:hypothetical protein